MSTSEVPISLDGLAGRYLDAQLAGDRFGALALIRDEGLGAGVAVPDLYLNVVQAAQREVGRLWQTNHISVAREHIATAISQVVMSHLYAALARAEPNGRSIVVTCVAGEQHDLGARMMADFYEMGGFDTRFLGADVPIESLRSELDRDPADLVALSCSISANLPALRQMAGSIRTTLPQVQLAMGGAALADAPELAEEFQALVSVGTAQEGLLRTQEFLGIPHDSPLT